jgi:DNA repair photolyase
MDNIKGYVSDKTRDIVKEQIEAIDLNKIMPAKTSLFPTLHSQEKPDLKSIERHRRAELQATYDLIEQKWIEQKRELPCEYGSMLEVSCRATECPMPLNMDVYSGGLCYQCIYCFAKLFEQSLYAAFYDNWELENVRTMSKEVVTKELEQVLGGNGTGDVKKAIERRIPIRLGIRTEDFIPMEKKHKSALTAMKVINDHDYPMMINTKSTLLGEGEWFRQISEMKSNIAVHVTITHVDDKIAKKLEMAAPSSTDRFALVKKLNEIGIRAIPRIEPSMAYINITEEHLPRYVEACVEAGAKHVTSDTYHYFANNAGIRENFYIQGFDYDQMFRATSDYQMVGSLFLEKLAFALQDAGVGHSTFNFHSIPFNSDDVCCGVGTHYKDAGFNTFNLLSLARGIVKDKGTIGWSDILDKMSKEECLNKEIYMNTYHIWNKLKYSPWSLDWCGGVRAIGYDEHGMVYNYKENRLRHDYERLVEVYGK